MLNYSDYPNRLGKNVHIFLSILHIFIVVETFLSFNNNKSINFKVEVSQNLGKY